jgi:preprotein translocase subunit SecG
MALSRRGGQRMNGSIWPGFVDAMTALLLVLMFVLSIFMIVQSVLRETIDTQDSELSSLAAQVAGLADALGLERDRADGLATELGRLSASLAAGRRKRFKSRRFRARYRRVTAHWRPRSRGSAALRRRSPAFWPRAMQRGGRWAICAEMWQSWRQRKRA